MDTSDDPITALVVGGAVVGGMAAGGAFRKPKAVTPPPLPPPEPEPVMETVEQAGEAERRRAMRRRGRTKTVITGALEPETTKKTLLG